MSISPNPESISPEIEAICACPKEARAACAGDAIYELESKKYCVMHYPSKDKAKAFWNELERKIDAEDYNFRGVYFPEGISFSGYKKTNEERFYFTKDANFNSATFNGEADFSKVTFNGEASFTFATFSNLAAFGFVIFSGAVDFSFSVFNGFTLFRATQFKKQVCFLATQFKDYVKFWREQMDEEMFGGEATLTFDSLRIEKPERLSFHSVKLRPHWFINTDSRKFEFVHVNWGNIAKELKNELISAQRLLKQENSSSADRLLSTAYRQLAVNAEDNNRYTQAAQLRYNSMDLQRKEKWCGLNIFSLDFWYWTLSGYGERILHATVALFVILATFAFLYTKVGFVPDNPLGWRQAIIYSFGTALLQKLEPRPFTLSAQACVIAEMFLAPLQAALLALAIRRKYMR